MSKEFGFRLLFAGVTALFVLLVLAVWFATREDRGRYAPLYSATFLPILLFVGLPVLALIERAGASMLLTLALYILISAAVYALALLALTPLLRRRLSADGCAALWVLPNLLAYWCLTMRNTISRMDYRLFTLRLPRAVFRALLIVWAAGFLAALIWRAVSHLLFRRALLDGAAAAGMRETGLLHSVRRELKAKNSVINPKLRAVYSPAADSPLCVGLLPRSTVLVLPRKDFTDDELRLIFRHELIHLLHQDNDLKFTLAVVCAAGWFVPSLLAGTGKAAEELELCCDELATEGMDGDGRRAYADLLLKNAGTARGFTTCLSASASGLRYRMGRVLRPEKRRFGVLIAAALSAAFAFCFGLVGFALEAGTFRTEILGRDGGGWQVNRVSSWSQPSSAESSTDEAVCAAMQAALSDLELDETPDHTPRDGTQLGVIRLARADEEAIVAVFDRGMIFYPKGEGGPTVFYAYRGDRDLAPLFEAAGAGS